MEYNYPDNPVPAKPGFLKRIWMLIYPMLVYEGVSLLVGLPFAMILMIMNYSQTAAMKPQDMVNFYEE